MHAWFEKLNDPSRDVYERRYRLLSAISIVSLLVWVIVAWVADGFSPRILFFGMCDLLFIPTMAITLRTGKIQVGAGLSAFVLVFLMLPFAFFYNGGIYAGAPNWCIIALVFVTLTVRGRLRAFLLASDIVVTFACYILTWVFPELVDEFTVASAYVDSLSSLIITAILTIVMFLFQLHIAHQERSVMAAQQQEILELNSAQNRFFSGMSHEIRTPVNTIIGLNEMILREDVSDEVAEDARQVATAGSMLLHLINDILDMSKLESGKMELAFADYSVGDMIADVVAMMWIHARDKGLELRVNIDPQLPAKVYGDEMRVKQILINVLNNAIKYTEQGSVTLDVWAHRAEGDSIVFAVTDTGIGIKKDNLPNLFSAFKRVESEQNRMIEGTGLGLSIVKQLVDLMGGSVQVNSVYMRGTTFTIELPVTIADARPIGEIDLEVRPARDTGRAYARRFVASEARVLVVDDNAANLMVTTKLLRDTQMQVETATNGEEALQKTLVREYHLIFMDHLMPVMDGVACLRMLRGQSGGMSKDAKVVALTANADGESKRLYAKEGFDGYLAKPCSGESLERECVRLLPRELVQLTAEDDDIVESSVLWMRGDEARDDIRVTTDSIADLPNALIEQAHIGIIPHSVHTDEGVFLDGKEIDAQGLVAYMERSEGRARTLPPNEADYELFFAKHASRANHVIHVSISGKVAGSGYATALEASKAFHNVKVIDSAHLSSGEGLLALEASRMAQEGLDFESILMNVEALKEKVHSSFIVDSLDYLVRANLVGPRVAKLSTALMIRPVLTLRKGEIRVKRIHLGSRKSSWQRYIASELRSLSSPYSGYVFVTYVGLTQKDLAEIKREIEKRGQFDSVIFQQASPAIAANCGPGTFGVLYLAP